MFIKVLWVEHVFLAFLLSCLSWSIQSHLKQCQGTHAKSDEVMKCSAAVSLAQVHMWYASALTSHKTNRFEAACSDSASIQEATMWWHSVFLVWEFLHPLWRPQMINDTQPYRCLRTASTICTLPACVRYHVWCWERFEKQVLPAATAINDSPLLTCVVIIDLNGLSMKNFTMSTQKVMSQIFKVDQVRSLMCMWSHSMCDLGKCASPQGGLGA